MITAKISYPKGMDFRDWLGWLASRKYFRQSKWMVCRTSRPWQHKNWSMFEKTYNASCYRSIFSCIFWCKWRCLCLCSSQAWKKCIWSWIYISFQCDVKRGWMQIAFFELLDGILGLHLCLVVSKFLGINHCVKSVHIRSYFGCIFSHSSWMRRDILYLSVFSPNVGKYGPE